MAQDYTVRGSTVNATHRPTGAGTAYAPFPGSTTATGFPMEMHTIVGVFDDGSQAQQAVDGLVKWGFTRDNVNLTSDTGPGAAAAAGTAPMKAGDSEPRYEHAVDTRVADLFRRLCSDAAGEDELRYYTEAVRRGAVLVTVTSGSDEGADNAADILNDCGAIDIEVHARYLRDSGWAGSPRTSATDGAARTVDATSGRGEETQAGKGRRGRRGVRIYSRTSSSDPR